MLAFGAIVIGADSKRMNLETYSLSDVVDYNGAVCVAIIHGCQ